MLIGKIFGIRLRLNPFFLLLLGLMTAVKLLPETTILFGIVLIHELAHTAAAKGFGQKVREVELLPFGGVARVSDMMEVEPVAEATVAAVGPMTNLLLAGAVWALWEYLPFTEAHLQFFLRANLSIGLFNLLPALPLDGGRIYRSILTRRLGFRRATEHAAMVAKWFAVLFGIVGVALVYFGRVNITLIVMAFFVFFASDRERNMAPYVFMRFLTTKREELREQEILRADHLVAIDSVPVKELVRSFEPKRYCVVLVVDNDGNLARLATEQEVIDSFFEKGIETPVGEVGRRLL